MDKAALLVEREILLKTIKDLVCLAGELNYAGLEGKNLETLKSAETILDNNGQTV